LEPLRNVVTPQAIQTRQSQRERIEMDWRKNLRTLEDWILKTLEKKGGEVSVSDIIEFVDWQNHTRYTNDEIIKTLNELRGLKKVVEKDGKWKLK
jgi:hypothetical protein